MVAVSEKVLELAGLMKDEAATVEAYNEGAARGLRIWAERIESAVQSGAPEWISVRDVRALRGWTDRYLRRLAQREEESGRARKTRRGWELRHDLVMELPVKPAHLREIRSDAEAEEFGRQMGARE